ncbi:MAG: cobalamin-dependent protein [Pseudomonadota bacterium]
MMKRRGDISDVMEKLGGSEVPSAAVNACLMPRAVDAIPALFSLVQADANFETFCRFVLVPAARQLGDAWVRDRLSFADVTVGMARLEMAVEQFGGAWRSALPADDGAPTVFFAALANTQHTFGSVVATRALIEAGWQVRSLDQLDLTDASVSYVRNRPIDMIALAVGTTDRATEAGTAIARLRKAAPKACIYLTGPAATASPELFANLGADVVGADVFDVARSFRNEMVA